MKDSRRKIKKVIKKKRFPKAIIFDIDGTLLDVRPSFYSTIIKASETWWKLIEKKVPPFEPDLSLIEEFKRFPGFNDDWEVAISIILIQKWLLRESSSFQIRSPHKMLQFLNPHGLGNLEEKIGKLIPEDKKKEIKKLCMEIYAGKECESIYGFKPSLWKEEGLWKKEKPLIDLSNIKKRFKIAIYTGRNLKETSLALNILKLNLSREHIITSDDFRKPDPRGLFKLVYKLKIDHATFVGDSEDDRISVLNYRSLFRYPLIDFVNIKDIIETRLSSPQRELPPSEPLPGTRLISFLADQR